MAVFEAPGRFRESAARQVVVAHRPARRRRLRGLIWGDTAHFEYISQAASGGLMAASLETGIPLAFGVLTAYTEALARGRSDAHTKGREAAEACLASMHGLRRIDAA